MVAPLVTHAVSFTNNRVRVYFSDPVVGLSTASNFTIAGLVVTAATASSDRLYSDLTTTGMVVGTTYSVAVGSAVDDDEGTDLSDNTASFKGATIPSDLLTEPVPKVTIDSRGRIPRVEFESSAIPLAVKQQPGVLLYIAYEAAAANLETYIMRAFNSELDRFVWWNVTGTPDFTGERSTYDVSLLSDIVLT